MKTSKKALVTDYLKKHPNLFFDYEKSYILSCVSENTFDLELMPDILRQVYDELDILDEKINIYIGFIQMLEKEFNIVDRNILEVGGGVLPRLAERISLRQDSGTITVYDPRLSIYKKDTNKLKLVREKFTKSSNVKNVDLMLGLMPCDAAEIIVETAIENKIDFMIALCEGGIHGDEDDYFEDAEEWVHSLIFSTKRRLEESKMGELGIQYMKKYGNPYPVVYNKK